MVEIQEEIQNWSDETLKVALSELETLDSTGVLGEGLCKQLFYKAREVFKPSIDAVNLLVYKEASKRFVELSNNHEIQKYCQ